MTTPLLSTRSLSLCDLRHMTTLLSLSFLTYKTGVITTPPGVVVMITWENASTQETGTSISIISIIITVMNILTCCFSSGPQDATKEHGFTWDPSDGTGVPEVWTRVSHIGVGGSQGQDPGESIMDLQRINWFISISSISLYLHCPIWATSSQRKLLGTELGLNNIFKNTLVLKL